MRHSSTKPGNIFLTVGMLLTLMLSCTQIFAMGLGEAKKAGLIGEQANGYLGLVSDSAGQKVSELVANVNKKRKARYAELASSQDVPLAQVEKQAGEKLMDRTEQGNYINAGNGWEKK